MKVSGVFQMHSKKSIALFIVLLSHLIACRPFGSVIYDLQAKCGIDRTRLIIINLKQNDETEIEK